RASTACRAPGGMPRASCCAGISLTGADPVAWWPGGDWAEAPPAVTPARAAPRIKIRLVERIARPPQKVSAALYRRVREFGVIWIMSHEFSRAIAGGSAGLQRQRDKS